MKKINFSLLFFVIFVVSSFNNQCKAQYTGGWFYQQSPVSEFYSDVKFSDINNGIIAGSHGTILKTTNSGNNWILINSSTNKNLNSIALVTLSEIYVAGDSGIILKSTDEGNNWSILNSQTLYNLNTIVFKNNVGFAAGNKGTLLRTTNSGLNWASTFSDTSVYFNSMSYINDNFIWATGQKKDSVNIYGIGYMIKTTNLGSNWNIVIPKLNDNYGGNSITFLDSLNGFCGFCSTPLDLGVLRTTDGGLNWECHNGAINCCPNSIYFINNLTGFSIGTGNHAIYKTVDGVTWIVSSIPNFSENLNSSYFINSLTGWAVGSRILKTTNGGGLLTNVIQNSENIPTEFSLQQNYPNPFNPSTKIKFDIAKSAKVKLTIFNSIGEKIETLLDESFQAGSYETDFDGSKYPSGIYFYRLEANGFIISRKMILLK